MKANRPFRREYDRLFKKDPVSANMMLLLLEIADDAGRIRLGHDLEADLVKLMVARFNDPRSHQLGGPKR